MFKQPPSNPRPKIHSSSSDRRGAVTEPIPKKTPPKVGIYIMMFHFEIFNKSNLINIVYCSYDLHFYCCTMPCGNCVMLYLNICSFVRSVKPWDMRRYVCMAAICMLFEMIYVHSKAGTRFLYIFDTTIKREQ